MSELTTPKEEKIPERVRITSYPKVIFLWPTWALSFFIWLIAIIGNLDLTLPSYSWVAWLWFIIFAFNLFVIAFEFKSATFLAVIAIIAVMIALFILWPDLLNLPPLAMNKEFYLAYAAVFTVIFGLLWLSRRFNYLEVTSQQISYHVGIMADERRYPAPSVHFEKRTEDIFERILPPFSAKIIMKQEGGEEAEILDCVPMVNRRLNQLNKILEHLQVRTK